MYYPEHTITKADLYAYTLLSNLSDKSKGRIAKILIDLPEADPLPETHKCPVCKKDITEPIQVEFLEGMGVCLGCDTLKGDTNESNR